MPTERLPQEYDAAVPVDQLRDFPGNPRVHDEAGLDRSLAAHGFVGAVLAQRSTGRVIAGHGRRDAAIRDGDTHVPVIWVDADDTRAAELLAILNRTEDQATYDDRALLEFLSGLPELDRTGYEPGDLADLEALFDDDAWGERAGLGGSRGGGDGDIDEDALAPRIELTVTHHVFDGWTAMLAAQDGKDDAEKLEAHLTQAGFMA